MKRSILPCLLLFLPFLFTSCEEETISFPESHWVLSDYTSPEGDLFSLSFYDDGGLEVQNANSDLPPFDETASWDYSLTRDSVLHISYEEQQYTTAGDESYTTVNSIQYDLPLSLTNGGRTLTLTFVDEHLFRHDDTLVYTFVRR